MRAVSCVLFGCMVRLCLWWFVISAQETAAWRIIGVNASEWVFDLCRNQTENSEDILLYWSCKGNSVTNSFCYYYKIVSEWLGFPRQESWAFAVRYLAQGYLSTALKMCQQHTFPILVCNWCLSQEPPAFQLSLLQTALLPHPTFKCKRDKRKQWFTVLVLDLVSMKRYRYTDWGLLSFLTWLHVFATQHSHAVQWRVPSMVQLRSEAVNRMHTLFAFHHFDSPCAHDISHRVSSAFRARHPPTFSFSNCT